MREGRNDSNGLERLRDRLVADLVSPSAQSQNTVSRFRGGRRGADAAAGVKSEADNWPKLAQALQGRVDLLSYLSPQEKQVLKAVLKIFATHQHCSGAVRNVVNYVNEFKGAQTNEVIGRQCVLDALDSLTKKGLVEKITSDPAYPYRITKDALEQLRDTSRSLAARGDLDTGKLPRDKWSEKVVGTLQPASLQGSVEPYGPIYEPNQGGALIQCGFCETTTLLNGASVLAGCGLADGRSVLIAKLPGEGDELVKLITDSSGAVIAEPLFSDSRLAGMELWGAGSDGRSWSFCNGSLVAVVRCDQAGGLSFESYDPGAFIDREVEAIFPLNDSSLAIYESSSKRINGVLLGGVKIIGIRDGALKLIDSLSPADLARGMELKKQGDLSLECRLEGISGSAKSAWLQFSVNCAERPPCSVLLHKGENSLDRCAQFASASEPYSVFSPNGEVLLTAVDGVSGAPYFYLQRLARRDKHRIPLEGYEQIVSAAFSPDSRYLGVVLRGRDRGASGCGVSLYYLSYTDIVRVAHFTHDPESEPGCCFWPSDNRFAFSDKVVTSWDLKRPQSTSINQVLLGKEIQGSPKSDQVAQMLREELFYPDHAPGAFQIRGVLPRASSALYRFKMLEQITALAPDPYHDGALCGLADGRVIYQGWGSSQLSNKTSLAFSGRVKSLSLSSTGRRILAITERGEVAVAGLDTQRDVGSGAYLYPSFDPLLGEFSPNGRFVVLVGAAPTIHQEEEDGDDLGEFRQAYNTPRDLCIEIYELDGVRGKPILKELRSFKTDSRPLGISFTSDRTGLIYSTVKGTVVRLSLFNVSGAECLPKVQVLSSQSDLISASQISSNSIGQVAFDRSVMQLDGDFASLGFNPSFELPIPRGSRVRHAWSPCEDILALSWLADGKPNLRVVSGTQRDRFGRPKVLSEFMLHSDVPVLAFTPRGDQLIACGTDCSLSVYGARD